MADMLERLRTGIRDVADFPKKGIIFKDITPILGDPGMFHASIDLFLNAAAEKRSTKSLESTHADFFLDRRSRTNSG